jgi:hypothetical protein
MGFRLSLNTQMAIFTTKITRQRLTLSPFSSETMTGIGNVLLKTIKTRIKSGTDVNDQPAKPLKGAKMRYVAYSRQKENKGLAGIRDWTYSGHLLRAMKVVSANENRFVIGFIDDRSDKIAHLNNRGTRMFGISPNDTKALKTAVMEAFRKFIKVVPV